MPAERTLRELWATALVMLGEVVRRWRRIEESEGLVWEGTNITPGPNLHLLLPNGVGEGSVRRPPNPAEGLHHRVVPPTGASGSPTLRRGKILGLVRVAL